jgi:hypothetical protein
LNKLDISEDLEDYSFHDTYAEYLTCPYCDGTGRKVDCYIVTCECNKCDYGTWDEEVDVQNYENDLGWEKDICCPSCGSNDWDYQEHIDGDSIHCEECEDGFFTVMWNTAFSVLPSPDYSFEEHKLKVWEMGFCLFNRGNYDYYLLMGSCGQDNTWLIHYTRYLLQGWLDPEDKSDCLSSGGYVFLPKGHRNELIEYFKKSTPTPEEYEKRYAEEMRRWDNLKERGQ